MKLLNLTLAALFLLASSHAFAEPKKNKLIRPDKVELKTNGLLDVTFTLPCEYADSVSIVLSNDDTGDRVVAVGVVYSAHYRNCRAAAPQQFTQEVGVEAYGTDGVTFVPMDIE